jgi:large subunit ribosomal protein L10
VAEPRPEKVAVVDEVRERFSSASAAILTEYRGLKVQEMQTLRRALTAAGGEFKVYKNTLVRRAARESGLAELEPLLEGPTGIAFVSDDVAAVAKVLRDFARTSPALVVKGGLVGKSLFDAKSAATLADLPPREVLLAQIAGVIAAPMQKFAGLLKALPQNFAYGLSALIDQRRADEPAAEVAPAATEEVAAEPVAAEDAADQSAAEAAPAAEAAATDGATDAAPAADEPAAAEAAADEGTPPEAAEAAEAAGAAGEEPAGGE